MKRTPQVYFSFRSPFSWMALDRLLATVPDAHETMEWIPFWEPDDQTADAMRARGAELHYVPMSKAKHLYVLQDTKRLAAAFGLPMVWPVDPDPWWEPSHLGWLKARHLGRAADFYTAVTVARWERGENISDPAVISAVAASIGMDGAALASAAEDPEVRAEGVNCLVRAYDEDVFGVPYFRHGRERFWGLDRLALFLRSIGRDAGDGRAADRPAAGADDPLDGIPGALRERVGAYDRDSAGGCG